jgi:hypothetical protein
VKLRNSPTSRTQATKKIRLVKGKIKRDKQLRAQVAPRARTNLVTATTPASGIHIPMPKVGRLRTVADWHRQVGKVYRAMRKGFIPKEDGTRLTYVANIGAQLAKYQEEIRELTLLREQLEAGRSGRLPALEHDAADDQGDGT